MSTKARALYAEHLLEPRDSSYFRLCLDLRRDEVIGTTCVGANEADGIQFGRCPVRGVFNDALKTLLQVQSELGEFVEVWKGLEDAQRAYELFDKGEVGKIAFQMDD